MGNRIVCLARQSPIEPANIETQVRSLQEFCNEHHLSGATFIRDEGNNENLDRVLRAIERGGISTLVVFGFAAIAVSTAHLLRLFLIMHTKGVRLVSVIEGFDSQAENSKHVLSLLASLAGIDRALRARSARIGHDVARTAGKTVGRKKARNSELIRKLLNRGLTYSEIAALANCSIGSVRSERVEMEHETSSNT